MEIVVILGLLSTVLAFDTNLPPLQPKTDEDTKPTTPRPLFKWDDGDDTKDADIAELNDTNTDMQGDEARLHMILYPHQRVITRAQRVRSGSELEEEEQKRQTNKTKSENPTPSILYVRRPLTGKSIDKENAGLHQYRRAALHYARTGPHGDVQIFQVPEDSRTEEVLRHLYWNAPYLDPRYASMLVHGTAGHPLVMTLTESQIAWINSLHPEVRDKYLRDLYGIRATEVEEGARAQAFLRRYEDVANYYYGNPYYYRQPLSVLVDDPVASFDYSCYQTEEDGHVTRVRAPSLPNAYIHRYDRRKNPNHPYNDYLAAEYRCRTGYTLVDYRVNELYCSQRGWVGTLPACVPRN